MKSVDASLAKCNLILIALLYENDYLSILPIVAM